MTETIVTRVGVVSAPNYWQELLNDSTGCNYGAIYVPMYCQFIARIRFSLSCYSCYRASGGTAHFKLEGPALRESFEICMGPYLSGMQTLVDLPFLIPVIPGYMIRPMVALSGEDTGCPRVGVTMWFTDVPNQVHKLVPQSASIGGSEETEKLLAEVRRMLRLMEKQVFGDKKKNEELEDEIDKEGEMT